MNMPTPPRGLVVWLLTERVAADEAMCVIGVFTEVERAKLAAAAEAETEEAPTWETVSWEQDLNAYRAALLLIHNREVIEIEFWILPFVLNRTEQGTELLRFPSKLAPPN
ncbi:MAG TPA: hypothetical protein VFS20_34055 [Longimicrobium sp.]|nr:hypothetical protein [Longimicrobium sp.]